MNVDDIGVLHQYNRLVRQKLTDPLTHGCGSVYTIKVEEDELFLHCYDCDMDVSPGLADMKGWKAHIEDIKSKSKE